MRHADRTSPRELIDRAKALVMARQGVTEQQAFRWLQQTAMNRRTSMRDIAGMLIVAYSSGRFTTLIRARRTAHPGPS